MYAFAETRGKPDRPLIFTFHGTGGSETQFHDLASQLWPGAPVISPRGDVSEHGALRYFRRTAEGVYDMADLAARTASMGGFLGGQIARLGAGSVVGLGYSNGANILAAVMMANAANIGAAVLMHPLIPWQPDPQPALAGRRILITAGERDPICPPQGTRRLAEYLRDQGAAVTVQWHPGGHEIAQSELLAIRDFAA